MVFKTLLRALASLFTASEVVACHSECYVDFRATNREETYHRVIPRVSGNPALS